MHYAEHSKPSDNRSNATSYLIEKGRPCLERSLSH